MKKIILSIAFIAVSVITFAQVAVGTTSPIASAVLDLTSTTQGFLPPRMTQVQMNAIAAAPEGLMVYCLDCIPKGIYVNTGDGSTDDDDDNGSTEFVNMITGESSGTETTTAIVDLISVTGRIWMDRNLGATQAATAYNDAAAAGDLYQWGRAKDGHQSRTSRITGEQATSGNPGHGAFIMLSLWTNFAGRDGLWQDGLNDPCPSGYRIPTETEFQAEVDNITTVGLVGAFDALKLPITGFHEHDDGLIKLAGYGGYYYTSTKSPTYDGQGRTLDIGPDFLDFRHNAIGNGMAIRCIKEFVNESITDTETDVEELVGPTGRIWMDRNLGATREATNLTDTAAYGDLYQWGRAKDGHEERDSDTTTTTATSANAGHGNFIIADATTDTNWTDFAAEDALWPTGLNDPCPSGYRIPTGAELEAELNVFISNDADGAFEALKLPLSGYRHIDGERNKEDINGYLWSSSSSATGPTYLRFNNVDTTATVQIINNNNRATGLPIRCIKKE